jgi:hypothetical protein
MNMLMTLFDGVWLFMAGDVQPMLLVLMNVATRSLA